MIQALVNLNGTQVVVIGITRANIDQLLDSQPILIDLAQLGLPARRIAIIAGETEGEVINTINVIGNRPS